MKKALIFLSILTLPLLSQTFKQSAETITVGTNGILQIQNALIPITITEETNLVASAATNLIGGKELICDKILKIRWPSLTNLYYRVDTSTNLKDWEIPNVYFKGTGTNLRYYDAFDAPQRYYRISAFTNL